MICWIQIQCSLRIQLLPGLKSDTHVILSLHELLGIFFMGIFSTKQENYGKVVFSYGSCIFQLNRK